MSAKVLLLDIETSPIISYTWGLFDQNVALNQIKEDWHLLAFAAKWLGKKNVIYHDQRNQRINTISNDKELLNKIWKLLDECDVLITQNGKHFDVKKLNARLVLNGMQPPSSFKHIDTYQIAKNKFGFTSNKLEYMSDKLCKKYKKKVHRGRYTGFELWKACLQGDLDAWNEMEKYNKYDVLSLEELYTKLIPWDSTVNFSLYTKSEKMVCSCGSEEFYSNGNHYTPMGKYQRLRCKKCGAERHGKVNLFTKSKRESLTRKV